MHAEPRQLYEEDVPRLHSLILMKIKTYQRRKYLESRMHKLINILKVNEIDFDAKVLNCNSLCINFICSKTNNHLII